MKIWWKKWTKFFQLSISEKWLFIKAFFLLSFFKFSLKILPFNTFKRFYDKLITTKQSQIYTNFEVSKAVKAINQASSLFPLQFTCLPKALTFKYLFKKQPNLSLHIGIPKEVQPTFEAHAWVATTDKILIGDVPNFNYTTLWEWT